MRITKVVLYDEPSVPEINIDEVSRFIKETFNVMVEKRMPIIHLCSSDILYEIAASKIENSEMQFQGHIPTVKDIEVETRQTDVSGVQDATYYDGFELQNALTGAIPEEEATLDILHIIFTDRLTCTYDHADSRYHGRAIIGSNPAIISTTGIIEAPAKSREYHIEMMINSRIGTDIDIVKEKHRGSFLEYHDPRLSDIVKGYVLQAIFYHETGDAFCDDVNCRLYNAHWQRDLLHSQVKIRKLCSAHQKILDHMTMT